MIIGISGKIKSGKDTVGGIVNYLIAKKYWKAIDWHFYCLEGDEERVKQKLLSGQAVKLRYDLGMYQTKKFADKLKDIVCLLLGCNRSQLEDRDFKETPLGKEWWVYQLTKKPRKIVEKGYYPNATDNKIADNRFLIKQTPRLILQLLGTEGGRETIHPNIWVNALMTDYDCPCDMERKKGQSYSCMQCTGKPNWIITDMRFPNELNAVKSRNGITIRVNRPETDHLAGDHASETALDNSKFDYIITNDGTIEDLIEIVEQILIAENLI
jgi:hypothetical protein